MSDNASLRIGIDTGGTFTDIVCVDDKSGAMRVTKVSSHAVEPGGGFGARRSRHSRRMGRGRRRSCRARARHDGRDQCAAAGRDRRSRPDRHRRLPAHSRDRAPSGARGLRQFVFLGEARPHRAAALRARGRRPPRTFSGDELRPLDEESVRAAARFFRARASTRSAFVSSTRTPTRRTSAAPPRSCARNIRTARCRSRATCCPNTANTSAR